MSSSPSSKFLWTVLFIVIIPLIGYALYSGLMVGKIELPGGFKIEFEAPPEALADDKLDSMEREELESRQAELEGRLKEMERQLEAKRDAEEEIDFVEPEVDISGVWQSTAGLTYNITQQGSYITIQEVNPLYGVTAVGEGELIDNLLTISYRTALNTVGQGNLSLSNYGRSLSGTFTDSYSGMQTFAQLHKMN